MPVLFCFLQIVRRAAWVLVLVIPASLCHAQLRFEEVSDSRGIASYIMPVGPVGAVTSVDFDADGDIDIFVPTAEGVADQLYQNDGNGQFTEIAEQVGLASKRNNRAAIWFDFDADHRLDLVIGGDCRTDPVDTFECEEPANLHLYRQTEQGQFEDVTAGSGLEVAWGGKENAHRSGIVAGDINNDGYLDLFVCNWNGRAWLFRNNADGTFSDITVASGMSETHFEHHQPIMYDFNRDGWMDIYVAVDFFAPNFLWINQGDGTFVDRAAESGVDNAMTDMGIALGDYDNDLDADLYITNITRNGDHDVLYRNDSKRGDLEFTEVSRLLGVREGYWGWGTTFLDADNDGWLDIALTNGKNTGQWRQDPSIFYYNLGGDSVTFEDRSAAVGFDDELIGASLVSADLDRDGDLDLLQTTSEVGLLRMLDNQRDSSSAGNNYLVVRPRMNGPNRYAIGAEVHVRAGENTWMRSIRTATSTLGQEPAEAFFGLGNADTVDEILVRWPQGHETRVGAFAANQVLTISDSEPAPAINAGFSDAWYNEETPGQGFFIVVFSQIEQVFLAWFTFDAERPGEGVSAVLGDAGHRWLTAQGGYVDNQAVLEVFNTAGGVFDSGSPAPASTVEGSMLLEFSDCEHGTISYQLDGAEQQSVIPVRRIASDNVALCESLGF